MCLTNLEIKLRLPNFELSFFQKSDLNRSIKEKRSCMQTLHFLCESQKLCGPLCNKKSGTQRCTEEGDARRISISSVNIKNSVGLSAKREGTQRSTEERRDTESLHFLCESLNLCGLLCNKNRYTEKS